MDRAACEVTEISVPVQQVQSIQQTSAAWRAHSWPAIVVVGQGPDCCTACLGAATQGQGPSGAIGDGGVAVEVGVQGPCRAWRLTVRNSCGRPPMMT